MTRADRLPLPVRLLRLFVLWFLLGGVYFAIEILWRLPQGQWPHPSMWIVGGLCGVAVGAINQIPRFFNMKMWTQALLGTIVTLLVELAAGLLLNVHLGLGIWDYSHLPGNLWGQICILFAGFWFLLMPLAIGLEDNLRWGFGWNGQRYPVWRNYVDLVRGR